jgi:formate dehydrogenase maturation protein FdhE
MTTDPHLMISMTVAAAVAWLMMRAGLAKNALEERRDRRTCPSCGRYDGCSCPR